MLFDNAQLALVMAVLSWPKLDNHSQLIRAQEYKSWLDESQAADRENGRGQAKRHDPPDTSWIEHEDVKKEPW